MFVSGLWPQSWSTGTVGLHSVHRGLKKEICFRVAAFSFLPFPSFVVDPFEGSPSASAGPISQPCTNKALSMQIKLRRLALRTSPTKESFQVWRAFGLSTPPNLEPLLRACGLLTLTPNYQSLWLLIGVITLNFAGRGRGWGGKERQDILLWSN